MSAAFLGLPTGSAIAINAAALFTGALLAVSAGAITWPLLALFAAAVILTTLFVNPRGVFLTLVTAPLLFLVAVVASGLVIGKDQLAGEGASSRAAQLLVVYPLVELFPWLFFVTLISAVIGVVRIQLIKRQNRAIAAREARERRRVSSSNRRTANQATSSRSVSVEELVRRERAHSTRR